MSDNNSSEVTTIEWTGTAGIEQAKKLQKDLLKAFKSSQKIALDLSGLDDIDITGIQLILAAKKEADEQKKSFFLTGQIPQAISEFVAGCSISLDSLLKNQE